MTAALTPPIDLRADHLRIVRDVLRQHLPTGVQVWVFGSRANWATKDSSDLDLALEGAGEIPPRIVLALETAFEESDLPFAVDVVDLGRIPERFRQIVERQRVPLSTATKPQSGRQRTEVAHDNIDECNETKLGDILTLKRGYDLPTRRRVDGPVPVVSSSGVTDHHSESMVSGPGVVTGRYGTLGKVFFIADDFWPLNTTLYVQDFKANDPRFISYFLRSLDVTAFSDKAAVPGLNRNDLHKKVIQTPPNVVEQRAIAHILGTLDDRIELNRRMNATLEAMARALFKSWFVDFDPVRAKMEGRDTGLPRAISDLFPCRLVEYESSQAPEGWGFSTIGHEVETVGGGTPSTKEPTYWANGDYCWATPKDLSTLTSPVLVETARKISADGVKSISSGLLPADTVLLSSRAPIGYLAITTVPTAVNQGFIAMICNRRLPNLYVLFWCEENLEFIKSISGGSTFPEISKRMFREVPVVVPFDGILAAYTDIVRPFYDRIVANTKECATLAEMRDRLLPELTSGSMRLCEQDGIVEAAV